MSEEGGERGKESQLHTFTLLKRHSKQSLPALCAGQSKWFVVLIEAMNEGVAQMKDEGRLAHLLHWSLASPRLSPCLLCLGHSAVLHMDMLVYRGESVNEIGGEG